jgi:hypothetical protein
MDLVALPLSPDSIFESQIGWFRGRALKGGDWVLAAGREPGLSWTAAHQRIDYGSTAECFRFVQSWLREGGAERVPVSG